MKAKVIAIVGPTASGKSRLAHELAKISQTEIISADSRLVYKRMDIGTAKPSAEEQSELPYHLIDVIEPKQNYSLGDYLAQAEPILANLLSRNKTPIVVGGTGFYFRGLLEDLSLPTIGPNLSFRAEVAEISTEVLYSLLKSQDSENKWKMHPNDRPRIIRALELNKVQNLADSQTPLCEVENNKDYEVIWIGLNYDNRSKLRERINLRTRKMIEDGLIKETQQLLAEYGPLEIFAKTIGYAEIIKLLDSEIFLNIDTQSQPINLSEEQKEALVELINISTSQYSKRQMTWFRANKKIVWLNSEEPIEKQLAQCLDLYNSSTK
jgi:tRNA dimethylallyltransferase